MDFCSTLLASWVVEPALHNIIAGPCLRLLYSYSYYSRFFFPVCASISGTAIEDTW